MRVSVALSLAGRSVVRARSRSCVLVRSCRSLLSSLSALVWKLTGLAHPGAIIGLCWPILDHLGQFGGSLGAL